MSGQKLTFTPLHRYMPSKIVLPGPAEWAQSFSWPDNIQDP